MSDVVGYVIIFALVVSAVSFVVLSGMTSLQDSRDREQAANAERAFDVIHNNMGSVYERNAPSRATEIDLASAELYFTQNVSIEVRGDGSRIAAYELRPIELRVTNEVSFIYEAGAVFRDQDVGGTMINEPPFLFTNERVHVPIVQTTSPTFESAGGSTILLRGKSTDRSVLESGSAFDEVTVTVASPRYELWESYLSEKAALTCTTNDAKSTVECESTGNPDIVYVTRQRIELSLIL